MSLTLQQQLLTNRLPLPRCFNGYEFNTIQRHSRKTIPSYLEEDLPPLKYHKIREQFKKINQIECPRLTYFKSKIQRRHKCQSHSNNKQKSLPQLSFAQKQAIKVQRRLKDIKEELKYTLMTSDPHSNLVNLLIQKANSLQEQKQYRKTLYSIKSKHRSRKCLSNKQQENKCFPNTISLVFSARKQCLMAQINNSKGENFPQIFDGEGTIKTQQFSIIS